MTLYQKFSLFLLLTLPISSNYAFTESEIQHYCPRPSHIYYSYDQDGSEKRISFHAYNRVGSFHSQAFIYTNHKPKFKPYTLKTAESYYDPGLQLFHCNYYIEFYDFDRFIERITVTLVGPKKA